jgi:hypothetical protein
MRALFLVLRLPVLEKAAQTPSIHARGAGGDPDSYAPSGIKDLDPRLRGERGGEEKAP